jgi:flagellar biosynthesis/type III secretory pathway chaperone
MQPTEKLAELIRKKHQVLMQLRDIGRRQADLVSSGEIAGLLTLLGGKQKLIAGLQELESRLKPYYADNPVTRVWRSPADRAQCAQLASECNALLEEIVNLEKLGAEKMNKRKSEVAEQLQQAHAAAHVRNAYQAQQRSHA